MKRIFVASGEGNVRCSWQKSSGSYLAAAWPEGNVRVFDRHGEIVADIRLPSECVALDWDSEGDTLALGCSSGVLFYLWNARTQQVQQIELGMKDTASSLAWSTRSATLAIGTAKGGLVIYDHRSQKKIPIMMKHKRKVTSIAWNRQNLIASSSEDATVAVSNVEGDTVKQYSCRAEACQLKWNNMKLDDRQGDMDSTLSAILMNKSLLLVETNSNEAPLELKFDDKYGRIVSYCWFGDGYVLLGFEQGYFVAISTHMKEIGKEILQARHYRDYLSHVTVSRALQSAASCGDNCVKFVDLSEMKETSAVVTIENSSSSTTAQNDQLTAIQWTDDGQLFAVTSRKGQLYVYLSRLPLVTAHCVTRFACLTSLREITILDNVAQMKPMSFNVEIEPTFIGIGPLHVAVGMNNRVWMYRLPNSVIASVKSGTGASAYTAVCEREYLGTVVSVRMNDTYAAIYFDGKVQLELIESATDWDEERRMRQFPIKSVQSRITCTNLNTDYLVYATDAGGLHFFSIADWQFVNELKHSSPIRSFAIDASGTRCVFADDKHELFVFNALNDVLTSVPDAPHTAQNLLWDTLVASKPYNECFVVTDQQEMVTYSYCRSQVYRPQCMLVGRTKLSHSHHPILLHNGNVTSLSQSGKIINILLATHRYQTVEKLEAFSDAELRTIVEQTARLGRFDEAWRLCTLIKNGRERIAESCWQVLGRAALGVLDVQFAIRVFRQIGDAALVYSLVELRNLDDSFALLGNIAMILGDHDVAQENFLQSTNKLAALEMRRDLLQHESALQLARTLAPAHIPFVCREYATQLEFAGNYTEALSYFEKATLRNGLKSIEGEEGAEKLELTEERVREHNEACEAGIARICCRLADLNRGVALAMRGSAKLKKDCAAILENMKQFQEAAMLYEHARAFDKAAIIQIRLKNWSKVGELLLNTTSPKLHSQYAKAREAEGRFKEAAIAYTTAGDWSNAVRLYLDKLNVPDEAVRIVKETLSVEAAKLVARFFLKVADFAAAIRFLVLSRCNDEAFRLAQTHKQMDLYAEIIGEEATVEDYNSIGLFYEQANDHVKAGKFYFLSFQYERALQHLLHPNVSVQDEANAIELAIEAVRRANEKQLTDLLIDYLLGESDQRPKDMKYLFKLHLVLKQFDEAAKTAQIIAREEQNAGNYRVARDTLFSMQKELRTNKVRVPFDSWQQLTLVHSYLLVKLHVKLGNHVRAARLLIRVAQNVSKFPEHVVQILTLTVIECSKAGMRQTAFSYASTLMRPEYRDKVDAKYRKKIEQIVRKPDRPSSGDQQGGNNEEEPLTACPFCSNAVGEMDLLCTACKANIPFCIASGCHLVATDLTACPHCAFLAIGSEFTKILQAEAACPICSKPIEADKVALIPPTEAAARIRSTIDY